MQDKKYNEILVHVYFKHFSWEVTATTCMYCRIKHTGVEYIVQNMVYGIMGVYVCVPHRF